MASIKKMNKALYNASYHLLEAGKHLSNVSEFADEANKLFRMAEGLVEIIKPEPEKVTKEKMDDILSEIMKHA
jgi:hypothetical protein